MKASEQTAILLYTMQSLKDEGSWCGETHVQKALFLCQELMGVPSNFKFILYKHGPYSFELSAHMQGLIADDLVLVLTRPPYGPTLAVSEEARLISGNIQKGSGVAERIDYLTKKISRRGVADLEKLATALYVNRKFGPRIPIEQRVETLISLKPHISMEAARGAFEEVRLIGEDAHSHGLSLDHLNSAA